MDNNWANIISGTLGLSGYALLALQSRASRQLEELQNWWIWKGDISATDTIELLEENRVEEAKQAADAAAIAYGRAMQCYLARKHPAKSVGETQQPTEEVQEAS